jgi:hypothetical protein
LNSSVQTVHGVVWQFVTKFEVNKDKTQFMFKSEKEGKTKWSLIDSGFEWWLELELNGVTISELLAADIRLIFV